MKTIVCTVSGMAAGAAAMLFVGWNAGLMGIPLPKVLAAAVELLSEKEQKTMEHTK